MRDSATDQVTEGDGFLPAFDRLRGHMISQQSHGLDEPLPEDHACGGPRQAEQTIVDLSTAFAPRSGSGIFPVWSPERSLPRTAAGIVVTAALCLSAVVGAASAEQRSEPSLLETIELWLVSNFDLPPAENTPELRTMTAVDLVALRHGPDSFVSPGDVVAAYDHGSRTIYLIDGWRGHDAAELSVLVHEMVHHLQASADMRFACPAERERLAYEAQDAWLQLFGENLTSAVNIDPAALLVSSVCTH